MYVDLRTPGLRLPRGRAHALAQRVRTAFESLAGAVARIVVRVMPGADPRSVERECAVEVHFRDGHVEVVRERRRRFGDVLARALQRARQRTSWRLGAPGPAAPPALPAPAGGRTMGHA